MADKKTSGSTWLVLLLMLVAGGYLVEQGGSGGPSPAQQALAAVRLDYQWGKGGFGSVMRADLTVTNTSRYAVRDLEVECVHYAKSGARIDSNRRTIFDVVPAGQARTFADFNMGLINAQADRSACQVVGVKV